MTLAGAYAALITQTRRRQMNERARIRCRVVSAQWMHTGDSMNAEADASMYCPV